MMLEPIRAFFGRVKGLHPDTKTVVSESTMWRCVVCGNIFRTKEEGNIHGVSSLRCVEHSQGDKIVPHKVQA
jgi:hypothetical protein